MQQQSENATHQSDVTYPVNFQELRSVSLSMPVFAHIGIPLTALSDGVKRRAKASSLDRHEQPLAKMNDTVWWQPSCNRECRGLTHRST